jgi:hypothetical protein
VNVRDKSDLRVKRLLVEGKGAEKGCKDFFLKRLMLLHLLKAHPNP